MLFFKRKKKPDQSSESNTQTEVNDEAITRTKVEGKNTEATSLDSSTQVAPETAEPEKVEVECKGNEEKSKDDGFFSRIKRGLSKTSSNLGGGIASVFLGKKQIDDDLLEELETQLLMADVGMSSTIDIIEALTEKVSRKELKDPESLHAALKAMLANQLVEQELTLTPSSGGPFVMLVVGVNGVGKTTTIGKLSKQFQARGKSVMLAAGDTFRAAAVEQLQVWGERNDIPVIAQHTGADSASVIYDAVEAAKARNIDILIADTAGRLHNKANLMTELEKVVRVMKKLDPDAPHEVLLVLDAGTGQNAISQTKVFSDAVDVSGIALTKLDGTAKGGIIFALNKEFDIPVRYIGVGEGVDDLQRFEAQPFIDAIFTNETTSS